MVTAQTLAAKAHMPISGAEMAEEVERRLFEAGLTLACLPSHGLRPSSCGSSWQETLMELDDLLSLTAESQIRPPMPTSVEISRMDEALGWVQDIRNAAHRRVVLFWMMVHPVTQRHYMSWERIGEKIGRSDKTAKSYFYRGLASITKKIYT
ncbi:DUF6362 family protein [Acetobacter okinawensis]|uniref:DUF6362 family protein n=1 Tax=Acetobacter okinawensis TaxID=1076594 RepID=UPI0039EC2244